MRNWKSYSMAFAFFALCSVSIAGCDISGIVADVIAGALGGNGGCVGNCASGCGGCSGCSGCSSCSCSSCSACSGCGGCAVSCDTVLRDLGGRNQGFQGTGVHPNRRIGNSIQGRLSTSGYQFIVSEITPLVNSVLPMGGVDLGAAGINGTLYIELRQFQLFAATGCSGNATNALGANHDCVRTTFNAYYRTCDKVGTCTAGEKVNITVNNVPVLGSLTCQLALDARGLAGNGTPAANPDAHPNGLPIRADVATIPETLPAVARANYSRGVLLDAEVTDVNSLEGSDVWVNCPNVGVSFVNCGLLNVGGALISGVNINCNCDLFGSSSCTLTPTTIIGDTINSLRGQLNPIVDAQVNMLTPNLLCYPAYHGANGSQTGGTNATAALDCPTGTTYQAPAMGAVSAMNPGKCMITGANPARCMDVLLGAELRVDMGGALAVVTPGIEAVIDAVVAAQGHIQTRNNGTNLNLFGGMEGWFAGIRALPHNPCVGIEHPANAQADCDALGSGYEYDAIPNGAFSGRCIPRIPIVPEADRARTNVPFDMAGGATVDPLAGDGDYEAGGVVSADFIDYAAWKMWDSGLFCLNVGTSLSPLISPSLIGLALLAPETQPRLFFPLDISADPSAANTRTIALMIKPQQPPMITVDEVDDPCEPGLNPGDPARDKRLEIIVDLNQMHIDLSVWNDERYARVGTIETDVHVVVALDNGPQAASTGCNAIERGGVDIAISTLQFSNAHYLPDAPMLTPFDFQLNFTGKLPAQSGFDTIGEIGGGIAAGLLPKLNAETLVNMAIAGAGASLGGANIPIRVRLDHDAIQVVSQPNAPCSGPPWDTGVRGTATNCTYDFIAAYIDLCDVNDATCNAQGSTPLTGAVETSVQVTNVTIPSERAGFDMQNGHFGEGESPTVEIAMSATGPADAQYEYSYHTSYTGWSDWQRSPYAVIRDRNLFVQGDLQVFAIARVAGVESSADLTPASADFRVDVTAPLVQVYGDNGIAQVQAIDYVSDALQYRTQDNDGDWSDWQALPANGVKNVGSTADLAAVEVRDEDGNVASTTQALQGRPNAAANSACGTCATVGANTDTSPFAVLGGLAALGAVVARRRRRS